MTAPGYKMMLLAGLLATTSSLQSDQALGTTASPLVAEKCAQLQWLLAEHQASYSRFRTVMVDQICATTPAP